ncbi:hypothetical protein HK405_010284, partial [Cladochytrium tenue]
MLEFPVDVLLECLQWLHPHAVQRLRRCCRELHNALALPAASLLGAPAGAPVHGDSPSQASSLVTVSFAVANLRSAPAWPAARDGGLSQALHHIRDLRLCWAKLGPYYVAALFAAFGFSRETVEVVDPFFANVVDRLCHAGMMMVTTDSFRPDSRQMDYHPKPMFDLSHYQYFVSSFKRGVLAQTIFESVRLASKNAHCSPQSFFSDYLGGWLLLVDDDEVFEHLINFRNDLPIVPSSMYDDQQSRPDLLVAASRFGSIKIARLLVSLSVCQPSREALEIAIRLNQPDLVRFLTSEVDPPIEPGTALSADFVADVFSSGRMDAIEALLEAPNAVIDGSAVSSVRLLPWRFAELRDHPGLKRRAVAVMHRLLDSKSLGTAAFPALMKEACAFRDTELVIRICSLPGVHLNTFMVDIAEAGLSGVLSAFWKTCVTSSIRSNASQALVEAAASGKAAVLEELLRLCRNSNVFIGADVYLKILKRKDLNDEILRLVRTEVKYVASQACATYSQSSEAADFHFLLDDVSAIEKYLCSREGAASVDYDSVAAKAVVMGATNILHATLVLSPTCVKTSLMSAIRARNLPIVHLFTSKFAFSCSLKITPVVNLFTSMEHLDLLEALSCCSNIVIDTSSIDLVNFLDGFGHNSIIAQESAAKRATIVRGLILSTSITESQSLSLLQAACRNGDLLLVRDILSKPGIESFLEGTYDNRFHPWERRAVGVQKAYVPFGATNGDFALIDAAKCGHIEVVRDLLKFSKSGLVNPLALDGAAVVRAASFGRAEVMKLLIDTIGACRMPTDVMENAFLAKTADSRDRHANAALKDIRDYLRRTARQYVEQAMEKSDVCSFDVQGDDFVRALFVADDAPHFCHCLRYLEREGPLDQNALSNFLVRATSTDAHRILAVLTAAPWSARPVGEDLNRAVQNGNVATVRFLVSVLNPPLAAHRDLDKGVAELLVTSTFSETVDELVGALLEPPAARLPLPFSVVRSSVVFPGPGDPFRMLRDTKPLPAALRQKARRAFERLVSSGSFETFGTRVAPLLPSACGLGHLGVVRMTLRVLSDVGAGADAGASSLDPFLRGLNRAAEAGELEVVRELLSQIPPALDAVLVSDMLQRTLGRSARNGYLAVALVVLDTGKLEMSVLVRWRDRNFLGLGDSTRRSRVFRLGFDRTLEKVERE